jgi:hypothetical protein
VRKRGNSPRARMTNLELYLFSEGIKNGSLLRSGPHVKLLGLNESEYQPGARSTDLRYGPHKGAGP